MWQTGGPVFPPKGRLTAGRASDRRNKMPGNAGYCCGDLQSGTISPAALYINGNKAKKKKKFSYYTRVFFQSYITYRLLVCPRTLCTPLVTPLGQKLQPVGSNIYVCLYISFLPSDGASSIQLGL